MISRRTITHLQYEKMSAALDKNAYFYPEDGSFLPRSNQKALQGYHEVGMGLWHLGVRHGDRVAVMSETRWEWDMADGGVLSIGAVVVSIYPASTSDYVLTIMQNSRAKVLILEEATQWATVQPLLSQLPELEQIIVMDPDGLPTKDWHSLGQLQEMGRQLLAQQPDLPDKARDAIQPEDLATLMYTSGTTGVPKGVALTHNMLFTLLEAVTGDTEIDEGQTSVIYLPMAHVLQRMGNYGGQYTGRIGYFAPAMTELVSTCQAAHPTSLTAVPRILEKIQARILARVEEASPIRQRLIRSALAVGQRQGRYLIQKKPVPLSLRLQHALFEALVYRKIRTSIFGKNIENLSSGAAPLSVDLMAFYYGIGLPIYEGYGLTETCAPITINREDQSKVGSVGQALPGSEIKIAEDGEILLKGPSVFTQYYNNPEATAEAFTEDGWFKSGDIGELDENGFLRITDRKKNLIITASGKNIPPAPIEQRLMQHPLISQVLVHGDGRNYLVALLTLDPESLQIWTKKQGKSRLMMTELTTDIALNAELDTFIQSINKELARFETIKYFRVLPEEFSQENGLITPSFKIKRSAVEERYQTLLDEMYVT